MNAKVSRPRSPTVAEELAAAARDGLALVKAAHSRATIVSGWPGGTRYTFEDGSCLEFDRESDFITTKPACKE